MRGRSPERRTMKTYAFTALLAALLLLAYVRAPVDVATASARAAQHTQRMALYGL